MTRPDQERVEALREVVQAGVYPLDMRYADEVLRAIATHLGIKEMVAELRQLADGLNDNGMPETAAVIHAHADMLAVLLAAGGEE